MTFSHLTHAWCSENREKISRREVINLMNRVVDIMTSLLTVSTVHGMHRYIQLQGGIKKRSHFD